MSTVCHVATRKGLFTLERGRAGWKVARTSFLGDNCTLAMHDPKARTLIRRASRNARASRPDHLTTVVTEASPRLIDLALREHHMSVVRVL